MSAPASAKSIRPMVAVHPHDETEPPAPSRLDACDRILENHRSRRLDTEPTSSLQEKGRVGLACEPHLLSHIAIDADVDQRGQSGCLEHLRECRLADTTATFAFIALSRCRSSTEEANGRGPLSANRAM